MTQRRVITVGPAPAGPYSPAIASGGLIFVSGLLASDAQGRIGGDIAAQTRRVLDRLADMLEAAGSDLAHAVTVHVYLRDGEEFAAMNAVYKTYFGAAPPSRTTIVADLLGPDALIEVAAVAVPLGARRQAVDPPGWSQSPLPYSYSVRAGDALFLSGLVARDRATNKPTGGTVRQQLDVIMANAKEILGASGLSMEHVTSARVYLPDAASFPAMNEGWRAHFGTAKPTRATVLAGLMDPAYAIEVTLIAHASPAQRIAAEPPSENLSGVVKAGSMVFISGMLAGGPGDAVTQTRDTLAKARAALARAGATPKDVVECTVWLPDLSHFAAMNASYKQIFTDAPPARVTVGAGLVARDALVEIAMTAILP